MEHRFETIELLDGLPATARSVELTRTLVRGLGDPALREENESMRRALKEIERYCDTTRGESHWTVILGTARQALRHAGEPNE